MSAHGDYYFRVLVDKTISKSGDILLMATTVTTEADGSVHFRDKHGIQNLIIPAGKWTAVNSASVIDGGMIGIEHWGDFHK